MKNTYNFISILIIIFAIVIIWQISLIQQIQEKEGFQSDLDPEFSKNYEQFTEFYNNFMKNWEKAIISAIATNTPQKPLTSPKQVASLASNPPQPSRIEINEYITRLSNQSRLAYPAVTDVFPPVVQIKSSDLPGLLKNTPTDPVPYLNALEWMNSQMKNSQANLGVALKGGRVEPFDDMCQNISQCIANNPELVTQAISENANSMQKELEDRFAKFNTNQQLQQSGKLNASLFQQSADIQKQAESGELLKGLNLPGSKAPTKYQMPDGGDKLEKLKRENPEKYNELQKQNSQFFSLKQLIEQINANI
jgi:hypothetical protein